MTKPSYVDPERDLQLAALGYIARGWPVIALHSPIITSKGVGCSCRSRTCDNIGKHPRTQNGLKDATLSEDDVRRWWTKWPQANVGIVTGEIIVIDVDPDRDGDASMNQLESVHGSVPETIRSNTGSGGYHLLFVSAEKIPNSVSLVGPGIDVRGAGGYIVAPPSLHKSKRYYEWDAGGHPDDVRLASMPEWLVSLSLRKRAPGGFTMPDAVIEGGRNNALFSLACKLQRSGVGPTAILATLLEENATKCRPSLDEAEVRKIAESATKYPAENPYYAGAPADKPAEESRVVVVEDWTEQLIRKPADKDGKRKIISCQANVTTILKHDEEWKGVLSFNAFTSIVETRRQPPWHPDDSPAVATHGEWADEDDVRLVNWLMRKYSLSISAKQASETARVAAQVNSFHPVKEYVEATPWDGVHRVDQWLSRYLGAEDSDYTRAVGSKWLISAIARVYKPGCKADQVLILEGAQGTGKSTALSVLAGQWFTDTPIAIGSKDAYTQINRYWIVELAELDSLFRANNSAAKAFFSSAGDDFRAAYGRNNVLLKRHCVLAGTVNPGDHGYLSDPTGARRYWPVECGMIDLKTLQADRDQLWAECLVRYNSGEEWWITAARPELNSQVESVQKERFREDPWTLPVANWLASPEAERLASTHPLTQSMIFVRALSVESSGIDAREQARLGNVMKALGWAAKRKKVMGCKVTYYTKTHEITDFGDKNVS